MLLARALVGFIFLFLVIASVLFGLSGTLHDGRACAMLAMFFGCAGIITVWLWFRDKALLERRVKAGPGSEPDPMQNVVQALAGLVFLATFDAGARQTLRLVSGAPRRFARRRRDDRRRLPGRLPHLSREHLHSRHDRGRRGPTRYRQRPLRRRAPPHVRWRARHDRRHPLGAWLMVGPDPGRPACPGPRVAAAARGDLSRCKPPGLRRLSRPGTLPAGADFLVVAASVHERRANDSFGSIAAKRDWVLP